MSKWNLPLKDRFMSFVSLPENLDECWEWKGTVNRGNGYGSIRIKYKNQAAHRISYMLFKGEIPEGLFVCHSCDNRSCVNPAHLWLGNAHDNIQDMQNKGRHPNNGARGEKHGNHRLTEQQVLKIRDYVEQGYRLQDIADMFNVGLNTISLIKLGKTWSWLK